MLSLQDPFIGIIGIIPFVLLQADGVVIGLCTTWMLVVWLNVWHITLNQLRA
jgi:hypothetical protein